MYILLDANSVWSVAVLRPVCPRKLTGYGLSFSIGVRHEHGKLEPQA